MKLMFVKRFMMFSTIPVLLQSCSSMYIPAVRSIPLFEKKGEFQAEAGISTNSIYANSSYAFTDNIAASINGNLSYRNFSNRYDAFTDIYKPPPTGWFEPDLRGKFAHRYGEVSVGKINMSPDFPMKLEIFGGAGMGRATDVDRFNYDSRYELDYYSFFGQGNLGLKKRFVEAGASVRLAYSLFDCAADEYIRDEYVLRQRKFNVFHVEPMLFGRIGNGNLKAVYRVGFNLAFETNPTEEDPGIGGLRLDYTVFHLSFGISYRIVPKIKQL